MKVTDAIGNTLKPGMKLFWLDTNLHIRVKDIDEGGIMLPGGAITPGKLTVEIDFGFKNDPKGLMFPRFLAVRDPEEEAKAEKVVEMALSAKGS